MAEISIIPNKQQKNTSLPGVTSAIRNYLLIIAAAVAVIIVYFILTIQKTTLVKQINQSQAQFSQNEAIIRQTLDVSSYELSAQLSNLSQILSSRLYWSNFLGRSDKIFNSDITIKSFKLDIKNFKVGFTGSAPSYDSLGKQLEDLRNNKDLVQEFSLAESSFADNSIMFKIDITFAKDILKGPYSL